MDTQTELPNSKLAAQVDQHSGKVPKSVLSLMDLEYLERSVHRMLCGWGNQFLEWDDKITACRHVWDQAEIVRRMRTRIEEFPGVKNDGPVSNKLEALVNTVLCAPTFEDAVDGIYQTLSTALVNAYLDFTQRVDPIHDAPTHQIIQEIVTAKDLQRKWRNDYRRENPHTPNVDYIRAIEACLQEVGNLTTPLAKTDTPAEPVGVKTEFRPLTPRIHQSWLKQPNDLAPYIAADFSTRIETRRLFWPIGYMRELGLALEQLQWIYDSPYMPWAFHYDETRHMWDESRHGDSGYSRLKDFGISIEEVGFSYQDPEQSIALFPTTPRPLPMMSASDLYGKLFFICMIAETGHFRVKREAYADFRDGGDLQSAEMMLFDIIDETTHVQYGHRWMDTVAKHAGIDSSNYESEAAIQRSEAQVKEHEHIASLQSIPREKGHLAYDRYLHYQELMRKKCPLSNAKTCPPRSTKPM